MIIIKDSTELSGELCAVNVRLEFVYCCNELELKGNTAIVKQRYRVNLLPKPTRREQKDPKKTQFPPTTMKSRKMIRSAAESR